MKQHIYILPIATMRSAVVKLLKKDDEYYTFSIQQNENGKFGKAEIKEYRASVFKGLPDQTCIDIVKQFQTMPDEVNTRVGDPDIYDVIEMEEESEEYERVGLFTYISTHLSPMRVFCLLGIAVFASLSGFMVTGRGIASDPTHQMSDQQKLGYYQEQIAVLQQEKKNEYNDCVQICEVQGGIYDGEITKIQTQKQLVHYGM